jgi:hypothetical protein
VIPILRNLYLRLDLLQQGVWTRVTLSALAVIVGTTLFGMLIVASSSLREQRLTLIPALVGQNIQNQDEHARTLYEEGRVVIDGRTYENERLRLAPERIFDEQGTIASPAAVTEMLLGDQKPAWAPDWLLEQPGTTLMLGLLTTTWLLIVIWLGLTLPLLLTLLGMGIPVGLGSLLGAMGEFRSDWPAIAWLLPWFLASESVMLYITGVGLFTFTFIMLTRLAMAVFDRPNQVFSVAHTVMKEASRTKLSLVFIVLLLLILPLLPLHLDPESPLRFRVQTFISRSFAATFWIAAILTIFLSCASIAFEIRDRQIWQLMTKPMNRLSYLVGKWTGVMSLNLIIVIVAGLSTFTYIQYLRKLPVAPGLEGMLDGLAVRDQVLTARLTIRPRYPPLTDEQLRLGEEQAIRNDSELSQMDPVPLSVRRFIQEDIKANHYRGMRSIPSRNVRSYVFEGLEDVRKLDSSMTLRYRFYIMGNDDHEVFTAIFRFNDDQATDRIRNYVPTQAHVLPIGTDLIQDDGTIKLDILNAYVPPEEGQGALNFEMDGLELLHKVANFEGNYFRAILMVWIKLAFLSALGICCATFLSFPVACLTSFTVFVAGMLGPFVADSLGSYAMPEWSRIPPDEILARVRWIFTWLVRSLAYVIVYMLEAFGEYQPAQNLVEGRLIPWFDIVTGILRLMVMWSGISLLIGYVVMRNRQLAIYSGQG